MNKKEILKELFPEKNEAELNDLVSSIDYKNNNKTIEEITSEDVEETANILDYNSISNLSQFLSMANRIGENKRFDKYYKRIFNRRKDAENIDYWEWDKILEWLIRQLYAQPHKSMEYLVNLYRTVKINHDRNQELNFDPWIESRYKEFESWLVGRVNYLLFEKEDNDLPQSHKTALRDLKSIFKEPKDYEKIINKLVQLDKVVIAKEGLVFKGYNYQLAEIFNVLNDNGFIEYFNDKEIVEIAKNTFKDFKASDRSLRTESYGKSIDFFKQFLI